MKKACIYFENVLSYTYLLNDILALKNFKLKSALWKRKNYCKSRCNVEKFMSAFVSKKHI